MKLFLPFVFVLLSFGVHAQPPQFGEPCSTEKVRLLVRFATINNQPGVPGEDWVAIIDSDGLTVARDTIISLSGYLGCPTAPGYALDVFGRSDFGIACPQQGAGNEYGLDDNEQFRVVAWDASTGVFYTGDEVFTYTNSFLPFPPGPDGNCDTLDYSGQSSLPVEFSYIHAENRGGKVAVEWATATEINSDYMEIQRSRNFANFETIGRVDAAGTSESLVEYYFQDAAPLVGENYYRVKQVDYDGRVMYSGIVLARVGGSAEQGRLRIFPNPASGSVNLSLDDNWNAESVEVTLVNAIGREVKRWRQATGGTENLQLGGLPAGLYLVRASDGKRKMTRRLLVK